MASFITELEAGTLTVKRINGLIECNESVATECSARLSANIIKGKLRGRVYYRDNLIQERFYEKEYMHILLARMNWDFNLALAPLAEHEQSVRRSEERKRQQEAKEQQRENRLSMGERAQPKSD